MFVRNHKSKYYRSKCYLNHDGEPCDFSIRSRYTQKYYTTECISFKTIPVMECINHGTGDIDLLREKEKIKLHESEAIIEKPRNNSMQQRQQDDVIVIMVTENKFPSAQKFVHFTKFMVIDLFTNLLEKANLSHWYKNTCNDYAKYMYKMHQQTVSLSRLTDEAEVAFVSFTTYTKLFLHFFHDHLEKAIPILREYVLSHEYREYSVDGTQKFVQLLKIWQESKQYTVNASLNFAICGGTSLIANRALYPGRAETHQNIAELLIKPIIQSLNLCTVYKPLVYGIGIDNATRDFNVGIPMVEGMKQSMAPKIKDNKYVTDTGVKYDHKGIAAMVQFSVFLCFRLPA